MTWMALYSVCIYFRLMLKLPELQDLFAAAELEASENPQVVVVQFMKALGKGYANAQVISEA